MYIGITDRVYVIVLPSFSDASLLEQACLELRGSISLRKLLGIVLNLGNKIESAGEGREGKVAKGLCLDSLSKLPQVKAFDEDKTSFLHYVVMVVDRNNSDLLSQLQDDLTSVFKADRISWGQHQEQLRVTKARIESVRSLALQQAERSVTKRNSHVYKEEVLLLRATRVGMFVVNASKIMSEIQERVNELEENFANLMRYFALENSTSIQPHDLFGIITAFVRSVNTARNDNKVRCDISSFVDHDISYAEN